MISGVKLIYQSGIFCRDHFLLLPIDAPDWVHDILLRMCLDHQSTYQIVEEKTTMVGYEFSSEPHILQMAQYIRVEEQRRFAQLLLSKGTP